MFYIKNNDLIVHKDTETYWIYTVKKLRHRSQSLPIINSYYTVTRRFNSETYLKMYINILSSILLSPYIFLFFVFFFQKKNHITIILNMNTNEIPLINVPYPPELTVEEILSRRTDKKLRSRAPNQYFIYRLAYIKELKKTLNGNIPMIKISPYISLSWSREPPEVKEAYKRLSDRVENRLNEIRRNDTLIIIHENLSSPPPPPTVIDEPTYFYSYFEYYYNYCYYDYYNNCYYFY
jgi:hypothetical protein